MINKLLLIILCICSISGVRAQMQIIPLTQGQIDNLDSFLVSEMMGCNVEVLNVEYTGNPEAVGLFNYIENDNLCEQGFDLDRGLLMTTGKIDYAVGPNNSGDDGEAWNVEYQDDFIHNYLVESGVISPSVNLYDACVLEFDITSSTLHSIDFEVVFGSEEYTEWMSPYYADVFCFFVSEIDGNIDPFFNSTPQNIMETGNIINSTTCDVIESKAISPWTIRPFSEMFQLPGFNECLYIDNPNGEFCNAIGYDGYTVPMQFNLTLQPEAVYRIKMIILDGVANYWAGFDSGVFIKKLNNDNTNIDITFSDIEYTAEGATVHFNTISTSSGGSTYLWDFNGDGNIDSNIMNPSYTFQEVGDHIVTLEVINDCTGETTFFSYVIVIDSLVNLEEISTPLFSVFPNPSTTDFQISSSHFSPSYLIEIFDISGRLVSVSDFDGYTANIDVSTFKSGLYYLDIKNEFNQSVYFEKLFVL